LEEGGLIASFVYSISKPHKATVAWGFYKILYTYSMTLPQKGFYIHYKHTTSGLPYNYIYEVVGIGRNTEEKTYTVMYRPLYENDWMPPADFQSRPLDMFLEEVENEGVKIPRFKLITDPVLIKELENVRNKMYL
jgi:hypothetical protein